MHFSESSQIVLGVQRLEICCQFPGSEHGVRRGEDVVFIFLRMFMLAPSPLKFGMVWVLSQTCLSSYWLFLGFHPALWFRYVISVVLTNGFALFSLWQTQVANLYCTSPFACLVDSQISQVQKKSLHSTDPSGLIFFQFPSISYNF